MSTKTKTEAALAQTHEATVKELKALLSEAEAVLAATGNEAAAGVAYLRDRTQAALEKSRETALHAVDFAKKGAREADKAIHQNPYTALGLAVGLGLLLGALMCRSERR